MRRRPNKKKNFLIATMIAVICFMAIGYAAINQQLIINGTAKTTGSWNIQFTNITSTSTDGASNVTEPVGIGTTTATFNVELLEPGDKMEYIITVSNLGNIDAVVESINKTESDNNNIIYTVEGIQDGTELKGTNNKNFKVIVEYDPNVTEISGETIKALSLNVNFVQR